MAQSSFIRQARFDDDINAIYEVIRENPKEVLPRPYQDILTNFDRFYVYEEKGEIKAVISWQVMPIIDLEQPDRCIEIISFSVRKEDQGKGIGGLMLEYMTETLKTMKPDRIIVLTFYPEYFKKFGFVETSKEKLYHKIYQTCTFCTKYKSPLTCPEVAMELRCL